MNITITAMPIMIASAQFPAVIAMNISANTNSATITSAME